MTKVVAFDIGIKNLAFCILENKVVHRLENCNILTPVEKISCSCCKSLAKFQAKNILYCKRHVPKTFQIIEKAPLLQDLQQLAKEKSISIKKPNKSLLIEALSPHYAFPFQQPKQPKASTQSLESLHDALRVFVNKWWTDFSTCTHVLLENQPAFKNPHMKSVQVLLFAVLREKFLQNSLSPKYHLVHAKKKVKDAKAGDEGYAERKNKSEERFTQMFESGGYGPETIYNAWKACTKRSDMADAFCMCQDFLSTQE
jgi:hypothetical protein